MRRAPPAAPQHKYWFRTANFMSDVLSSASFVPLPLKVHVAIDSAPSPNLGGRPIWKLGSHHELIVEESVNDISVHVVGVYCLMYGVFFLLVFYSETSSKYRETWINQCYRVHVGSLMIECENCNTARLDEPSCVWFMLFHLYNSRLFLPLSTRSLCFLRFQNIHNTFAKLARSLSIETTPYSVFFLIHRGDFVSILFDLY